MKGSPTRPDRHVPLENLLGNAWKFTGKRAPARIEFRAVPHKGGVAYAVRDNGVGFDMAHAGKMFGAFQRLHAMRAFPGTGIGLAIVHASCRDTGAGYGPRRCRARAPHSISRCDQR